jgi:cell division transport system permease protein
MFLVLKRTLIEGWHNFIRGGWLAVVGVSVLVLALCVINIFYVIGYSINDFMQGVQAKESISIYLNQDLLDHEIQEIKTDLEKNENVKSVEYISKETALENFKRDNAGEDFIMQSLQEIGDNPMLPVLIVKANNHNQYLNIQEYVKNFQFSDKVSRVNYEKSREIINKLNNVVDNIRKIGLRLGIVFVVISVLIIFNTIKLVIYTQRKEIKVMRLVGASNTYIRLPFIFNGVIIGVVSAVIATALLFALLKFIDQYFPSIIPSGNLVMFFVNNFFQIFGAQVLFGVIVGVFSSLIAIGKYLKA